MMKKLLVVMMAITTLLCLTFAACGGIKDNGKEETPATYTVTISVSDDTYGTVSKTSIENVAKDTAISVNGNVLTVGEETVTATATANTAQYTYAFTGFTGTADTVTGNMTITANFSRTVNKYTITFEMGDGTAIDPMQVDYGTSVSELNTISVTAPTGYHFVKWQLKTGENTYEDFAGTETLERNITVKAVYEMDVYTVSIATNNAEYGTVSAASVMNVPYGTAIIVDGSTLTVGETVITATANEDDVQYTYDFVGFTGTVATVTGDMMITASFTRELLPEVEVDENGVITMTDRDKSGAVAYNIPEAYSAGTKITFGITTSGGDELLVHALGDESWDKEYFAAWFEDTNDFTFDVNITSDCDLLRIRVGNLPTDGEPVVVTMEILALVLPDTVEVDENGVITYTDMDKNGVIWYDITEAYPAGAQITFGITTSGGDELLVHALGDGDWGKEYFADWFVGTNDFSFVANVTSDCDKLSVRVGNLPTDGEPVVVTIEILALVLPDTVEVDENGVITMTDRDKSGVIWYDITEAYPAGAQITFGITTSGGDELLVHALGDGDWDKAYFADWFVGTNDFSFVANVTSDCDKLSVRVGNLPTDGEPVVVTIEIVSVVTP